MCGLVGVATREPDASAEGAVERAVKILHHRGPEAARVATFRTDARTCVLGHTRLRIIDVREEADQPLANEDESLQVVFNGELYNFKELRAELGRAGHRFVSETDTEVLVHLYEAVDGDPERLLSRLRGMYAFALFDVTRGRLLLARDRLGIKPMYHAALPGGGVAFASEVQALLRSGLISAGPDTASLIGYLLWGSVQGPRTIAGGIRELPPASYLLWDGGGTVERRWWEPTFAPGRVDDPPEALANILSDAIRRHLVADREVGLFLSGGVDSGSIATLAAREGALRSMTVTFPEVGSDEGKEAADLAARLSLQHDEVAITGAQVGAALPAIAYAMDQPTDDGVNSWIVSKAAHDAGLVVALSGVGGDELFGGYRSFATVPRTASIGAALRPVPRSLRRLAADRLVARRPGAPMSRILMASPGIGAAYRTVRGLFGLKDLDRMGVLRWIGETDAIQLFTPHDPEGVGPRDAVALLEMERYMRNQLLRDTDTMSMSHSLEVRVPLLDDRVLDLALTLPSVVRNRSGKALLQQAAGFRRAGPKQGFTLPFDVWMRGPLHDLLRGSLLSESMPLSWLVTSQARRAIWEAFESGRVHWSRPWALGMLRLWADGHDLRW